MAFKLPKFFSAADAKSRIFLVFAAVVVFALLIYLAVRFLGGPGGITGATRVANAPSSLQSVPGGQLSPEYYRAIQQANQQAAQQAQISGGSAVPTLLNVPNQQQQTAFQQEGNCTVQCSDQSINVADDINDLVKSGKLPQDDANKLLLLAKNNVPVSEYAASLDALVRQGKLTPEQARKLLEEYKKQHQNALTNESGQGMDGLIKSGQLSLETANALLALQKSGISTADYAAELNRLVKEGKISPALAAQLLGQYTQQRAREAAKEGDFSLRQMAKSGQITPDVAQTLSALQSRNGPVDQYAAELNQLVAAGKMTPAAAAKLLEEYKAQRAAIGAMGSLNAMQGQEEANSVNQLGDMLKSGKLSADTVNALFALQQKGATPQEYQAALDQLVKEGKISPEDAKKLMAQYQKLVGLRLASKQLSDLQGNNASVADYTNALKSLVQSGAITPEMANSLLQEYKGSISPGITPTVETNIPGTEGFAKLQQRVQQAAAPPTTVVETEQFTAAANQAEAQAAQDEQQRIAQLATAMSAQAQTLITSWQPPSMKHTGGGEETGKTKQGAGAGATATSVTTSTTTTSSGPILVKAGTILFAVLDTAIDSDYPDTPVLATIVSGDLKGAKLLGSISVTNNAGGVSANDRVAIKFKLMNRDDWDESKAISAFAIDPDTARTIMASSVDNHYLKRYGAMFAGSFMSGYSSAITQSGATNNVGIFGTSTTTSPISPAGKLAVGLGQVGTALTNAVSAYVNIPPTVKVNSGVGLGILFMSDLSA